jgi:hypothetical protein
MPTEPKPRKKKMADIRAEEGARRRQDFLECVQRGLPLAQAQRAVGWKSDNSYREARRKFPRWAAEVDFAKNASRYEGGHAVAAEDYNSFPSFVGRYVPDRRPHLPHQLQMVNLLENLGPREVVMFLIWPEAGKTATLEDYICRKLALDPSHRFRYVSEASDLAKRVIGTVKRRMTDDAEYASFLLRYGPFYEQGQEKQGRPWTTEQISIQKNPGTERDRNLVASSWTSAVYGSRIDTLILDDLCTQRNYNQSADIVARIRGTFFNRGKLLRTLIVGTRIGPGDFYERFLDAGLVTKLITLPAMLPTGEPSVPAAWDQEIVHDGGACCGGLIPFRPCPKNGQKLTPKEFLVLMRHVSGEDTWFASYQQSPRADELSTFAAYLDRCLDHDRLVGQSA